jgi:hypothetical protein
VALGLKKLVNFFKDLLIKVKQLTISGEINIGTNSRFTGNIDEVGRYLAAITETIKKDNYFLNVQLKKDLYELNIKIFAYHKIIIDRSFLEDLRRQFQSLLDYGANFEGLTFRLNVYGELGSLAGKEKFRYVNKQAEVVFLNNESPFRERLLKKLSFKQIWIFLLIALVLIAIVLLVYFDVIPLFPKPLVA